MTGRHRQKPGRAGLQFIALLWFLIAAPMSALAAPYAAMVVDARSGEVLHSENADTPLHPASLTKMMTLYIAFEAVEHGELTMDTVVTISRNAAAEPPSKLGLRSGQKIKLRYLVRAAAVIASMVGWTKSSLTATSRRTFLSRFTSTTVPR